MIFLGNLLMGLGEVLSSVIMIFIILMIARAVLSWVSPDPGNMLVQFINNTTEPILWRARSKIPPLGMFDVSVILVIFLLVLLDRAVAQSLIQYGYVLSHSVGTPVIGM